MTLNLVVRKSIMSAGGCLRGHGRKEWNTDLKETLGVFGIKKSVMTER